MPLDWRRPECWPETISYREFPSDFLCLLMGHGFKKDSYKLVKIRLCEVVIDSIDFDDDRDLDPHTGEPSLAYVDCLKSAILAGRPIPPIVVGNVREGSLLRWGWPYDGRHRLNAAKALGLLVVPGIDVTGMGTRTSKAKTGGQVNHLEKEYAKAEAGFLRFYLGLNFAFLDANIRRSFSEKGYRRILRALREPVMLSETSEAILDVYENHVSFILTAHSGNFAVC